MPKKQTSVLERTRFDIREPHRYKVVMYNDDVTTVDFVEELLMSEFGKSEQQAQTLTLRIHNTGSAVVGLYSYDIAVSKTKKAIRIARDAGFPLIMKCLKE